MGFRTEEEEGALEGMSLDEYLVKNREATFMLRMRGNGMREAAIADGDLLVVDRSREPQPHDIVVAVIDGAFCARYMRDLQRSDLGDVRVEAVVIAVIRRL
ncbi:MAG TPA: S24 family peptidase [Candidatus Paceibacterota bacterium]|nr:S24 family peptidase [Candidatus Paceibacterota bacterium]